MKILILGWGSLIWKPGDLPIEGQGEDRWQSGGPVLPIEFSRVSSDARLTLVIDETEGTEVPTRIAKSTRKSLIDAVADLRQREGTTMKNIGFSDRKGQEASYKKEEQHAFGHKLIFQWLTAIDADAVVWTALETNYHPQFGRKFGCEHAAEYLQSLPKAPRANAVEYINRAPKEVATKFRRFLIDQKIPGILDIG